jgi:hypothetical protein
MHKCTNMHGARAREPSHAGGPVLMMIFVLGDACGLDTPCGF